MRQAGQVQQASLILKLINDGRHADLGITLGGEPVLDRQRLAAGLQQLRETLPLLPHDPYLLLNHNAWQSQNEHQQAQDGRGQPHADPATGGHADRHCLHITLPYALGEVVCHPGYGAAAWPSS